MAEDIDKRPIVYYRNTKYYLNSNSNGVSHIEEFGKPEVKKIVEGKNLLTEEEQEEKRKNTRSQHITW